jgi:enamine deaminase RidA (YjgF/YER057c/UK114 family)
MPRTAFSTDSAPQPKNPISQCVRTGSVVAASGQVGKLLDGTLPESIEEQAPAAFRNLIAVLAAGGAAESRCGACEGLPNRPERHGCGQ